ncbi:hypothetical protein Hypma_014570 [Hypsizygus marmoreus]|uniref:Uncharacterized protein n=1 Tax=Hypsizygus marmoreus TaxID=39966 RepID=A0A369J9Z6_HYPMA|nr:hypothetical protein Hypma_014570 [Hypsizygus marmoreus]
MIIVVWIQGVVGTQDGQVYSHRSPFFILDSNDHDTSRTSASHLRRIAIHILWHMHQQNALQAQLCAASGVQAHSCPRWSRILVGSCLALSDMSEAAIL